MGFIFFNRLKEKEEYIIVLSGWEFNEKMCKFFELWENLRY